MLSVSSLGVAKRQLISGPGKTTSRSKILSSFVFCGKWKKGDPWKQRVSSAPFQGVGAEG